MEILRKKIFVAGFMASMFLPKISSAFILPQLRVAPEISLNISNGSVFKPILRYNQIDSKEFFENEPQSSYPWNFGVVLGYTIAEFFQPEIGIKYSYKRSYALKDVYIFEESSLDFPIRMNILWNIIPLIKIKGIIGYKIAFILTSKYTVSNKEQLLKRKIGKILAFQNSVQNLKKNNSDFSSLEHSLVLGFGLDFPFGIYINFTVSPSMISYKNTMEDYRAIHDKKENSKPQDKRFIQFNRVASSALLNLQLGVNIMSFF